jgi:hypothetical protein
VDGRAIAPGPLHDEFRRLERWWSEICNAVNISRQHRILLDETDAGISWCISMAGYIVDGEKDLRLGRTDNLAVYKYHRQQLWERFENLERGLMSNGVARP